MSESREELETTYEERKYGRDYIFNITNDIVRERLFQNKKWGRHWGTWDRPLEKKLAVLMEEVGEVAKAILDDEPVEDLRSELVQVAAVCVQWIEHLDCSS